jgi:hypothetical protein
LPNPRSWIFIPILSSESFVAVVFTFKYLLHFDLIFVYGVRLVVQLHSFACRYLVIQASLIQKTVLSSLNCLVHCQKLTNHKYKLISIVYLLFCWSVYYPLTVPHHLN